MPDGECVAVLEREVFRTSGSEASVEEQLDLEEFFELDGFVFRCWSTGLPWTQSSTKSDWDAGPGCWGWEFNFNLDEYRCSNAPQISDARSKGSAIFQGSEPGTRVDMMMAFARAFLMAKSGPSGESGARGSAVTLGVEVVWCSPALCDCLAMVGSVRWTRPQNGLTVKGKFLS